MVHLHLILYTRVDHYEVNLLSRCNLIAQRSIIEGEVSHSFFLPFRVGREQEHALSCNSWRGPDLVANMFWPTLLSLSFLNAAHCKSRA